MEKEVIVDVDVNRFEDEDVEVKREGGGGVLVSHCSTRASHCRHMRTHTRTQSGLSQRSGVVSGNH